MKAAIVGGTGYGAIELIRFLHLHPYVDVTTIISRSNSGESISSTYPHLRDIVEIQLEKLDIEELAGKVELVFFAAPPGVSKDILPDLVEKGVKCIDLSGDFRLKDPAVYEEWYGVPAGPASYLQNACYGLTEMYKEEIGNASFIANPGCYPTATLLGLMPALKKKLIDPASIIIDAKSGVSGAGRSPSAATHYSEMNENFKAYKLGQHKHIPEIEQIIGQESGQQVNVTFTTHLVPMTRGIMATMYADLKDGQSTADLLAVYQEFYKDAPFVRIRPEGTWPATREVYGSNYCDIGLHADERTGRLTIVSVIDNLVKGASGQAIHNMNVMCGWEETTGLGNIPIYP